MNWNQKTLEFMLMIEKNYHQDTNLIYLGVGEFEYLSGKSGKIQIRVVTTKGNISKGKFSLDLAKKLLASIAFSGIIMRLTKTTMDLG